MKYLMDPEKYTTLSCKIYVCVNKTCNGNCSKNTINFCPSKCNKKPNTCVTLTYCKPSATGYSPTNVH